MEEGFTTRLEEMDREALLAEIERLRWLIEANPQVPWEADAEGNITDFSQKWLDLTGLKREDALGGGWIRVPHPDDLPAMVKAWTRSIETGEPYDVQHRIRLANGDYRWMRSRATARRGQGGEVLAWYATTEDIHDLKGAEEGFRRTQESLGLAMKGGRMGWWRRDFLTKQVTWSRELEDIFGLKAGAFDGSRQRFLDFIHADDRERYQEVVASALEKGEDYAVEFRFRRADGSEGWMEGRGLALYDDLGSPLCSYGIGVDVTERKTAEVALRRSGQTFESLVKNSPLGVYAVDADFRLALVSRGAQKVFENVRPLLGRDFSEVMRVVWEEPFASDAIALFRHVLETGEPYHSPTTVERRLDLEEDQSYDWKIERIAMPDGRLGVVCNFYDLSERQRHEAELERRVKERTAELTRANRDLNEFAYSVAHDLRAPLRAIVSASSMLIEDVGERLSDDERAVLERQASNGLRLARIVDDLLGFARLANAKLQTKDFDMTALVEATVKDVAHRWGNVCEIEVRPGMHAVGDVNLVGYALTNLLDNACKFSPQGGLIEVGETEGAFFVRDRGVGFDMAHAHKLFVAFERLVDQETFAGTGVGLANVKRIVERHGGRVWAESEPRKGSIFWFTLG